MRETGGPESEKSSMMTETEVWNDLGPQAKECGQLLEAERSKEMNSTVESPKRTKSY